MRPLTDRVIVRSAVIVNYSVVATLIFFDGPSSATVLANANAALADYIDSHHKIDYDVTLSGIFAALHQPGVQNVVLTTPSADVVIANYQAAFCTAITLTNGGVGV